MPENYQKIYEQALKELYAELCGPLRNSLQGLLNFVDICNNEKFKKELPSLLQESATNAKVCMGGLRSTSENMGKILMSLPPKKLAEFNKYMAEKTQKSSEQENE